MNKFDKEQIGKNIVLAEQHLENGNSREAMACALIAIAKIKFRDMKEVR